MRPTLRSPSEIVSYDGGGRLLTTTLDYVANTANLPLSKFAYDATGALLGYCPATSSILTCDATNPTNGEAWHYAYDVMGRQTQTIPPDNTTLTDLNTSETVYDAGGRVSTTCSHPAGGSCTAATNVLRTSTPAATAYDKLGHLLSSTTYRDTSATEVGTTTNTYNSDGSVATTTATSNPSGAAAGTVLGNSDTISYTYDAQGRPDLIKRGATTLTDFDYSTAVDGYGQISSRNDSGTGATSFVYDWASRLTTTDGPTAGTGDQVTQTWRLDGLLASRTLPTSPGETDSVSYDALKRPKVITRSNGDTLTRAYSRSGSTRSDDRSLTGTGFGFGATGTDSYTYDSWGRLVGETGLGFTAAYTYDADFNRTSKTVSGTTTSWAYDRSDQLKTETEGSTTSFGYDTFGNMTTKQEPGSANVTTMTYADGSRMSGYRASGAASDTTFAYDALGRTAKRTDPAPTSETYDFVGATETVWRSTPGTGTATTSLVDATGGRLSVTQGATTAWTLFDELGSMAALVSSSATLSAAYRFDAFGNALTTVSRSANPYGFTGSINLGTDAVPLYEMGARFYAPSVGAFSQMDSSAGTAADPASLNRFLYAQASPTTLVDPTGHTACSAYADYCPVNGSTTKHTVQKQDATGHRAGHRGRRTTSDVLGDQRNRARSYSRYGESGQYEDAAYRSSPKIQKIAQTAAADDARESASHDAAARTYSPPAASDDGGGGFFGININIDIHVDSGLVHAGLDVVGMLPVVGTAADLANAGIYAVEGDYGMAAMSAVSAIPVVGDVLGAGKLALKYGDKALEAGEFALKHGDEIGEGLGVAAKYGDEAVEGLAGAGKRLEGAAESCLTHSFAPSTLVATPSGDRAIGDLEVGDEVTARDAATGETSAQPVEAVLVHDDAVTGTVVIDGENVSTTPEHPFFTLDRGFVPAKDLEVGELVASEAGDPGRVDAVVWDGGPKRMFDLTVATDHTFFVGHGGWWVHNCEPRDLIDETINGSGRFTSQHQPSTDTMLDAGMEWVGRDAEEMGLPGSGVFKNADGTRVFRIDKTSLLGTHKPFVPHAHLEIRDVQGKPIVNNHIPLPEEHLGTP